MKIKVRICGPKKGDYLKIRASIGPGGQRGNLKISNFKYIFSSLTTNGKLVDLYLLIIL